MMTASFSQPPFAGDAVALGSRRELFVDQALVAQTHGALSFPMHSPVARELVETVLDEHGCSYRYMTVLRDGEVCRMYYALVDSRRENGRVIKGDERICVVESRDGIHWERPRVGLFSYKGNQENNIVWIEDGLERNGVSGFSPFVDINPDCPPSQRYKAVAEAGPKAKQAFGANGLFALCSADGIHWQMLHEPFVMTGGPGRGNFDTQNVAFWDAVRGEYRLYRREYYYEGPERDFRDVLTATSKDFIHWSEPERLCYPGSDPVQLYTNNVLPYYRAPHLFIGLPVRYVRYPWDEMMQALPERERREWLIRQSGADPGKADPTGEGGSRVAAALTDVLLMSSRDGRTFHRRREAFLRPGPQRRNNWFYPDNYPAWGMLETPSSVEDAPEELSFYVSEGGRREGQSNRCRRHTLRVDGFVSAQAGWEGGELVTRPVTFSGRELRINFSTSVAGMIRVELQDAMGWPVPGFSLADSVPLLGDELERKVAWRGSPDLSALAGVPVRIRFHLRDADLYSFQFR